MRREQQTLVGGVNRELLPESARDEERTANTGRRSEQRASASRVQGMRREQQTLVGGVNRELLPESARDEERTANTGRRSEQRASARECKG